MCELSDDGYSFYNLGTQDSAWFLTVSGVFQLSYNASDEGFPRYLFVLICVSCNKSKRYHERQKDLAM